ncbi:MAG TPA: hypothetical protein VFE37_02710 [Chloroflexota bacterium]|nr:hypothetical protein [Chloroflexota bacterium]
MHRMIARCGRCQGQMAAGYDGEVTCLWCGEVVYPPPRALYTGDDIDAWRASLRGKPGRPRRSPPPDAA